MYSHDAVSGLLIDAKMLVDELLQRLDFRSDKAVDNIAVDEELAKNVDVDVMSKAGECVHI